MKKWNYLLLVGLLLIAGTCFLAGAMQQEQQIFAEKLIRLHVVANSDAAEDQNEKLNVRDAVLAITEPLVQESQDPRQALADALPEIKTAAEACLAECGSNKTVTVSLGKERFPTRYYDGFALPAGVYPSLRVTIGEGKGQNWWCVAFPSVCFCATAEEMETAATAAGFTEDEFRVMAEDNGYVLKFKIWELLGEFKGILFSGN